MVFIGHMESLIKNSFSVGEKFESEFLMSISLDSWYDLAVIGICVQQGI